MNENSGSHQVPQAEPQTRGIVIDIKHIIAVAAFLGFGVGGGGIGMAMTNGRVSTDDLAKKSDVEKLGATLEKIQESISASTAIRAAKDATNDALHIQFSKDVQDLEKRIDDLEGRRQQARR